MSDVGLTIEPTVEIGQVIIEPAQEVGLTIQSGPQGIQGQKGDKGDTGDKGDQGDKGDKGDTGSAGPSMWTGTGTFTVINNQSSPADVTGLLIDPDTYRGFILEYSVYRNTTGAGATELSETGSVVGSFKTVAVAWFLSPGPFTEESAGVTLSITALGQIQYVSTDITGTPDTSVLNFKWRGIEI